MVPQDDLYDVLLLNPDNPFSFVRHMLFEGHIQWQERLPHPLVLFPVQPVLPSYELLFAQVF